MAMPRGTKQLVKLRGSTADIRGRSYTRSVTVTVIDDQARRKLQLSADASVIKDDASMTKIVARVYDCLDAPPLPGIEVLKTRPGLAVNAPKSRALRRSSLRRSTVRLVNTVNLRKFAPLAP